MYVNDGVLPNLTLPVLVSNKHAWSKVVTTRVTNELLRRETALNAFTSHYTTDNNKTNTATQPATSVWCVMSRYGETASLVPCEIPAKA